MAKKTAKTVRVFTATINTTVCEGMSGVVISADENGVMMKHKKPRSKKYLVSFIPWSNVLYCVGSADFEEGSEITLYKRPTQNVAFDEFVGSIEDSGVPGMVRLVTEDGAVMMAADSIEVSGDDDEEEEKPAKKATKRKPAKKAKDEEEDEEDEEEEDEDEEEEKPRKSSKRKPAKKAKDEEEDEEWEDEEDEEEEDEDEEEEEKPRKSSKRKPAKKSSKKSKDEDEDDDDSDWDED